MTTNRIVWGIFALVLTGGTVAAQSLTLTPVPEGVMSLITYYIPQSVKLTTQRPAGIKVLPKVKSPLYGVLPTKSDGRVFSVVLDEPESGDAHLYVDTNGNGDLTDDPPATWLTHTYDGHSESSGGATVSLVSGVDRLDAHLNLYRFDKKDPNRAAYKDSLFYYRDYGWKGTLSVGTKSYSVLLLDDSVSGDLTGPGTGLLIDRDGDGKFDLRWERYADGVPFNLDGTTYELAGLRPLGGNLSVVTSRRKVAALPQPPDHRVGQAITAFQATDLDGKAVSFPADYRGKVVLIDFWATWCPPCVEDAPDVAKAYAQYHAQGFDILGVSLDNAGDLAKVKKFLADYKMPWREVYDGGAWSAAVAKKYFIDSIPSSFLVDGDTGLILADSTTLRGGNLASTVAGALAARNK